MPNEDVDILVVGAGPAGLCAGWNAARRGASVLVVDKKRHVGEPVRCAEASFLPLLGMFKLHEGPWILNPYHRIVVHTTDSCFTANARRMGPVAMDRKLMEEELSRRVAENG